MSVNVAKNEHVEYEFFRLIFTELALPLNGRSIVLRVYPNGFTLAVNKLESEQLGLLFDPGTASEVLRIIEFKLNCHWSTSSQLNSGMDQ